MPSLSCSVVDAFACEPFQGNPAAVVAGGDELTVPWMQRIACEFNLSETVFLLRPSVGSDRHGVRLRWFTPQCEVSFCGHATLAAIHTICEQSSSPPGDVAVECAAGNLTVQVELAVPHSCRYWLSMPRPTFRNDDLPPDRLIEALCMPSDARIVGPVFRTRDSDVVVFLRSGQHVRSLSPNQAALARLSQKHNIRGVSVATTDSGEPGVACISRFFAPAAGIPEDPVTGSVHGPLASILIHDRRVDPVAQNKWSFTCRQVPANGRLGTVYVRAQSRGEELAIEVGGSCVTVIKGQLSV